MEYVKTQLSCILLYYAYDDMFRPLWAIFRSQKYIYTYIYYFVMLTTCFGHCGPSSGHKNVYIHTYSTLLCWRHVSATVGHLQVTKKIYIYYFVMLTTCFGHCGPSSGHKNVYIHTYSTLLCWRHVSATVGHLQVIKMCIYTYIYYFVMLTTCFGYCGPSLVHKNVYI